MLQPLGIVLIFGTIAAVIVAMSTSLFERRGTQAAAGAVAGAWVGVLIAVTMAGVIRNVQFALPAFFAVPFAIAAIFAAAFPGVRQRMLGVPRRLILGINVFRVNGFLFVALAFAGQLSGPFPFFAGIGDMLTGLLAIPLALGAASMGRSNARLIAWNILGALDLVTAVTLGVTSAPGSPLQLIHAGVGSSAITQLPWSLIPLFLVPCFLIGHVIVFAQMRTSTERIGYAVA